MNTQTAQEAKMKITRQMPSSLSSRIDSTVDLPRSGKQGAAEQRKSWRRSMDWLTSPAFRLHQYRNIHTQMLRGALCTVDCGNTRQKKTDFRDE
jgi:hypothetical protein